MYPCEHGDGKKIPGISAAGKSPEMTDYTPAADAELVETGSVFSISNLQCVPLGSHSGSADKASMLLTGIPCLLSMQVFISTKDPVHRPECAPGGDIRNGRRRG